MITIITLVKSQESFDVLKKNLVLLEADLKLGLDLLCLTNTDLYIECREFLLSNFNRGECIVTLGNKLEEGLEKITDKNPYIFVLAENVLLSSGCLKRLLADFTELPYAGFISGIMQDFDKVVRVENIYDNFEKAIQYDLEGQGLIPADLVAVQGMLMKEIVFRNFFSEEDLDGYGKFSFGIKLRRQGYTNWLDTKIKYRNGGER